VRRLEESFFKTREVFDKVMVAYRNEKGLLLTCRIAKGLARSFILHRSKLLQHHSATAK
jgi:hypothetical protein